MTSRWLASACMVFFVAPGVLLAQPREFGAATFTPPPGWEYEARSTIHTMTRIRGTELCTVAIYGNEPSPRSLDAAFATAWSTVFQNYRSAPRPEMQVRVSPAGYRHAAGEGELVDNGNNRFIARMHVFPTGERTQTIVLVSNSRSALDSCRPDWDSFFASLRFPSVAVAATETPGARATGARPEPAALGAATTRTTSSGSPMTRDNVVFNPPAGWNVEQGSDGVMLIPADTRGNEALRVWLLPGRRSTGNLQQEFEQTWADVRSAFRAEQLLTVNGKPFELQQPGRSPRGWDYLQGNGGLRLAGSQWDIDITVIKAGDRIERVAVLSRDFRDNSGVMLTTKHNPRYTRALRQFIFTLQFANLPSVAIPPAGVRGNGIIGVWRGIAMSFGSLKPHFAIFFDNGRAFFGPNFPVDGLLGIDPSVEEPGSPRYWGRYTFQNDMGSITMPYGSIPVARNGADLTLRTNNTDHRFGRLPMLEARHIEGTWCLSGGQCLRFTSAGRFEDNGAARIVEHSTYAFPETPERGQGQYEVRDFTLILRYDGGPEVRIALLALAGTPTAPQMLLSFNIDVLTRR